MSALDRLENYSARNQRIEDEVFDVKTPEGALLSLLHNRGYKMYDEDKNFTELYNAITTQGNQKVQATAGSGKTTMLLFKIMRDIVTGDTMKIQTLPNGMQVRVVDKVFVGTFLRSGADELQQKLSQWQRELGYTVTASQITFGTLHAEFKRCLNAMGVATPIGSPKVLSGLVRKAVSACNIKRDGDRLRNEDYKIIESIIAYYRGRLDSKRYEHPSVRDYDLTPTILDLLVNQYSSLKKTEGVMDFDDLQELLYKYIYVTPNKAVQDFVANRYNYMYLDEFQDTSQIQYALVKAYMRDYSKESTVQKRGKLVVVGDVEQCIYSFRGSDIEVMRTNFDRDFDSTHSSLSYNYRCPSNILRPIIPSIDKNKEAEGIEIKPAKTGGTFGVYGFRTPTQMLEYLKKGINEDIDGGKTIGVLCRTNYDGLIPALALEISGRYNYSVTGEGMTLSSALPKRIFRVASLFTDRGTAGVRDTLTMLVPRYMVREVNSLVDTMKQNHMRIWDVPMDDLKYSCEPIANIVQTLKTLRSDNGDMEALRCLYLYLLSNVFDGDSQYCESARAVIEVVIYLIRERNFQSIGEFKEEVELLDEKLHARIGKNTDIIISTVHEFKGKERDSIYIWNDSDGVFPSSKTDIGNEDELQEERRVHYIACTRAREKSTILCKGGSQGIFVNEMDANVQVITPEIGGKL